MTQPLFSIVLIAKNEERTLPKMLNSLHEFRGRGGEIVLVDTGSTDSTAEIARSYGCIVEEVGNMFRHIITEEQAKEINRKFSDEEGDLVKANDSLFAFADARNYAASLASNDLISNQDCDEEYTKLDIDAIDSHISQGYDQFDYNFVFSHDEFRKEVIKFLQSKFYNRKKLEWRGIVHEVLQSVNQGEDIKKATLDESIIKLEHWQNSDTPRGNYLKGLALDCYLNPANDRNSHYLARELLYSDKPKSAIKEFLRHISMNCWVAEKAQSMIFIGDAYGKLGHGDKQIEWYHKAFITDSGRRESLIKLAQFFKFHNEPQKVACYAAAAMEIPWSGYYANFRNYYEDEPHALMYWAKGWMGDITNAQYHILKALEYKPTHPTYLRDTMYYFNFPKVSIVIPTLGREDKLRRLLQLIEQNAGYTNYEVIVEHDSFEGRQGALRTLKKGVERSVGELVMFLGNDVLPEKNFLLLAVLCMTRNFPEMDGLVGLNDGHFRGEVATHWLASKKLLPYLGGEFFHTGYRHTHCDNELTERCRLINKYVWCEHAKIIHDHPLVNGSPFDEVYNLVYDPQNVEHDRLLYEKRKQLLIY